MFRIGCVFFGLLSISLVWSEVTLFSKSPVLSVFALLFNAPFMPFEGLEVRPRILRSDFWVIN
jgi:hypothetical protein